ncbi:hypothetical protein Tco_0640607 [Tanacetum coccineum]
MSLLTPLIHHPPRCKDDSNHFVSLTSTTYGSLNGYLNSLTHENNLKNHDHQDVSSPDSNFVINTWELMDGLDDDADGFDIIEVNRKQPVSYNRKICNGSKEKMYVSFGLGDPYELVQFSDAKDTKPLWKHLFEESLLSKMDSNLVNSYNKALDSKMVSKGFQVIDMGFICNSCGDAQFVPCPNCNGSRKVFEEDERRSIRCPDYNEDGLISDDDGDGGDGLVGQWWREGDGGGRLKKRGDLIYEFA